MLVISKGSTREQLSLPKLEQARLITPASGLDRPFRYLKALLPEKASKVICSVFPFHAQADGTLPVGADLPLGLEPVGDINIDGYGALFWL